MSARIGGPRAALLAALVLSSVATVAAASLTGDGSPGAAAAPGGSAPTLPASSSVPDRVTGVLRKEDAPLELLWAQPSSGWTATDEVLDGTYIWTDQVFDDRGAGTYTYPDGASYMRNAADVVEVRAALDGEHLVLGARLNTLIDEGVPVVAIGIKGPSAPDPAVPWPGAGVIARGVRWVVTLDGRHDGRSTVTDLRDGSVGMIGPADVDNQTTGGARTRENTMTVAIAPSDLGESSVPTELGLHAVAGFREPGAANWYRPDDVTTAPVYDVAFYTGDTADNFGEWEYTQQGALIASGDITSAGRVVDLSATDRQARPRPGEAQTRIYRMSIQEQLGEGIAPFEMPMVKGAEEQTSVPQGDRYLGLFTPYTVWVPANYSALGSSVPLFVSLHGLGENHQGVTLRPWRTGGISVPAFAIFPLGHAPSGYYQGASELDVLESLEDAKAALPVNDDRVFLTGMSMGGIGTYTVGTHRPDLFAGAVPVVGPGSGERDFLWPAPVEPVMGKAREYVQIYRMGSFGREILENALNVPYRIFAGVPDPLTTVAFSEGDAARWEELRYDYQYGLFPRRSHEFFTPYVNTLYHQLLNGCASVDVPACDPTLEPAGGRIRDENPARVVYKAVPFHWQPEVSDKLVFDGAYWVDGMKLRAREFADDFARIDVTSHALAAKKRVEDRKIGPEVRTFEPTGEPYKFQGYKWGIAGGQISNGFDATFVNLDAVTLDMDRMALALDDDVTMTLESDGATKVTMVGSWPKKGTVSLWRDGAPLQTARVVDGAVAFEVTGGDYVIKWSKQG